MALRATLLSAKLADQALRKSEEQYRLLAENMKDVVWVLDTQTLYFTYMSPSVKELRGYTAEEVLKAPMTDALMPEISQYLVSNFGKRVELFLNGQAPTDKYYIDEIEQPTKEGSSVWTEVITNYYINPVTGPR